MRRARAEISEQQQLVSKTPSVVKQPHRKRRRTVLESFQTMSLSKKPQDGDDCSSLDDGNSSCATGGSLMMNGDDDVGDDEDDDDDTSIKSSVLLSDQERIHRAIMYQLATGKQPPHPTHVVEVRVEQMIRQSRLQAAAKDDFHVKLRAGNADMMEVDRPPPFKRSNSLPRDFEPSPPIDMVEVPSSRR